MLVPVLAGALIAATLGAIDCASSPEAAGGREEPFFETLPLWIADKPAAVYTQTRFSHNSLPTLARLPDGRLFLTWSASIGFARGGRIVGAFSEDGGRTWGEPIELINNPDRDDGDRSIVVDGNSLSVISTSIRLPERFDKFNVWPVVYDRTWWWITTTDDGGKTWSSPSEVERTFRYTGKRANAYRRDDGRLLLGGFYETQAEADEVPAYERDRHCAAVMFQSREGGLTWTAGEPIYLPGKEGRSESAVAVLADGSLLSLLRNSLDRLYQTRSFDGGETWDAPEPGPLPARNAPAWIHRLENRAGNELLAGTFFCPDWRRLMGWIPTCA